MRRRWRKIVTMIILPAVGVCAIALLCRAVLRPNPIARRVDQLIAQKKLYPGSGEWNEAMQELWSAGPEVIPRLAAKARLRETMLSRAYAGLWSELPSGLQNQFPTPANRRQIRAAAMQAIAEFGPLA